MTCVTAYVEVARGLVDADPVVLVHAPVGRRLRPRGPGQDVPTRVKGPDGVPVAVRHDGPHPRTGGRARAETELDHATVLGTDGVEQLGVLVDGQPADIGHVVR